MHTLVVVLSLIVALISTQVPKYLQQYGQRLGGAIDELTRIVRNFDQDSHRSGYRRDDALALMKRNPERLVKDQVFRMEGNVVRLSRLNQQRETLSAGITVSAAFAMLNDYDDHIAQKTYENFAWGLQLSSAPTFALLGFLLTYMTLGSVLLISKLTLKSA